ncbi:MAG: FAD-binding protein, partial [Planctomycetes bacterium]|nr:FAD-binding protein [Planctomycetota bacterium]
MIALEEELARRLGRDRVSGSGADRRAYARDLWPLGQIGVLFGRSFRPPDLVVWPRNYEEVAAVLVEARRAGVPVVPVGGGSGVCGGTLPAAGGIALDLKGLDRLLRVDRGRLVARAQAGIIGETLERRLDAQGVTLGHFPSSIYCSTLG